MSYETKRNLYIATIVAILIISGVTGCTFPESGAYKSTCLRAGPNGKLSHGLCPFDMDTFGK